MNPTNDDAVQPTAVTVVATMRARAGHQAQLEEVLRSLIAPTRSDPGLITYELYQDPDDTAQFCFLEVWDSAEAHDQHGDQPHLRDFSARADELVDGGIVVHRLRLLDRC